MIVVRADRLPAPMTPAFNVFTFALLRPKLTPNKIFVSRNIRFNSTPLSNNSDTQVNRAPGMTSETLSRNDVRGSALSLLCNRVRRPGPATRKAVTRPWLSEDQHHVSRRTRLPEQHVHHRLFAPRRRHHGVDGSAGSPAVKSCRPFKDTVPQVGSAQSFGFERWRRIRL